MPLDVIRLLDSDVFAMTTGDEFKAALALWCKSWTQAPAASLPDDDRILAHLSGAGARWRKVKDMALRGWIKCSDGRLYHPVVAEKALEALPFRQDHVEKKTADAERKAREREDRKALFAILRAAGQVPPYDTSTRQLRTMVADLGQQNPPQVTPPVTPPVTLVTVDVTAKTGTGTGTVKDSSEDKSSALVDPGTMAWNLAVILLTERGRSSEPKARSFFGALLKRTGVEAREMYTACAACHANSTQDPQSYLTRSAEGIASRRAEAKAPKRVSFV
jgi:hypothetical protein